MTTHTSSAKPRKAISPLISAVLLIAIVFAIAAVISPWTFNLTTDVANKTSTSVTQQITCQSAAYDFDSNYETNGIDYDLSGASDRVNVKVVNTGTVNLYGFSIEIEVDTGSGIEITHLEINESYKKTEALPLKPGQSAILKANMSQNFNGTLNEVKVLNDVCPSIPIKQTL